VRGYKEEGTVTTPFDMCVLNDIDRLHLAIDVLDRVDKFRNQTSHTRQLFRNKLVDHKIYIRQYGEDMPEIKDWKWPY
jgi:xylulose-5-phosphate/fructose-6-phosphate phosphoketolase